MKKASEGNPMVWSRMDPDERQEAQELADELYDGNLSLLIRNAVRQFVRAMRAKSEREVAA